MKGRALEMASLLRTCFLAGSILIHHVVVVLADVGTASSYDPPYLPTKCNGYDQEQFPPDGNFVAVSDNLWDNGAACGRRYRMRCLSGRNRPCKGPSVVVEVVDFCRSPCRATMLLSNKAFDAISKNNGAKINVEFAQI